MGSGSPLQLMSDNETVAILKGKRERLPDGLPGLRITITTSLWPAADKDGNDPDSMV